MKNMAWLGEPGGRILHLQIQGKWQPYTHCPGLVVPDYIEPGGSKGWATFQRLRMQGWQLVPTASVELTLVES